MSIGVSGYVTLKKLLRRYLGSKSDFMRNLANICTLFSVLGRTLWIYVDLNQIRSGEAITPEESTHTSAFDRIAALRNSDTTAPDDLTDGWLCELTIDERTHPSSETLIRSATARRASDKGMLPISIADYLQLLDATGRVIRDDKSGSIPNSLAPILRRLGLQSETWVDAIRNYQEWFGHFVGTSQAIASRAKQAGKKWYRGMSHCAEVFG
jgi:hypothetical protein